MNLFLGIFLVVGFTDSFQLDSRKKCTEVTVPMCKGIGYNLTSVPNQFNHQTQDEAGLEVHQFWPLVGINCSPDLKFFLCSVYVPICIPEYDKPLYACRAICLRAKAGCAPLMKQYGFEWPTNLDCAQFPASSEPDHLCMDSNQTETTTTPNPKIKSKVVSTDSGKLQDNLAPKLPSKTNTKIGASQSGCNCSCTNSKHFKPLLTDIGSQMFIYNLSYCTYGCHASHISKDQRNFLIFWLGLCAVLCCASTFFTILTYLIDRDRFKYPERPIIFLAFCYFMVSIGFIVRLIVGHDNVACDGDKIRAGITGPLPCTVVFLLIYFFGMASAVWWVMLTLTWFLSAGLKWSNEAIANYSQYFHMVAWAAPSALCVAILALSAVDGDPYSGICYVGNTNLNMLRVFVIAPLLTCVILGSFFLVSGFISLVRIHNIVKQQEGLLKTDKLTMLMVKIGLFSGSYTIPAWIAIGCYFYEQHYRSSWEASEVCTDECKLGKWKPDFTIFVFKYFTSLVVGFTSGLWLCSRKTVQSWRRFLCRVFCCRDAKPSYMPAEAIIIKSHTDISSGYSRQYPMVRQF